MADSVRRQFDWLLIGSWILMLGFCLVVFAGVGMFVKWLVS